MAAILLAGTVFLSAQMATADDEEATAGTAGGGGWFYYEGARISFGFSADVNDDSKNSLVLLGRNINFTVHALEFSKIWFKPCKNGGYPSVHMKGKALVNETDLYRFHFKATDKGPGGIDALWLKLWPLTHGGDDHGEDHDDCSCSEDTEHEGVDGCDGGSHSDCQQGGCSGGGGGGCSEGGCDHGSEGGCDGGCSGGGSGGHGRMVRWICHGDRKSVV